MDALETRALAVQLEVTLDVDGEHEKLIANPSSNITSELRDGLQRNKDEIMRDLLLRQAQKFIVVRHPGAEKEIGSSEEVNAAYLDASFPDFRQEVRRWASRVIARIQETEILKTESEVFEAFREEKVKRGWEANA